MDGEVTIGEATVAADVSSVGHMSSLHTALYQRPLHCHDTEHISQFCICHHYTQHSNCTVICHHCTGYKIKVRTGDVSGGRAAKISTIHFKAKPDCQLELQMGRIISTPLGFFLSLFQVMIILHVIFQDNLTELTVVQVASPRSAVLF